MSRKASLKAPVCVLCTGSLQTFCNCEEGDTLQMMLSRDMDYKDKVVEVVDHIQQVRIHLMRIHTAHHMPHVTLPRSALSPASTSRMSKVRSWSTVPV